MLKNILQLLGLLYLIDLLGFISWAVSGQVPQGEFWFGRLTYELIRFIISLF